jgi:replicative superfamily II helicase
VFEMAMARFFALDLNANSEPSAGAGRGSSNRQLVTKHRKMVYISPSKALCEERFEDWTARLSKMNLGIQVAMVTGDGDPSEAFRNLTIAHLILTTPEKVRDQRLFALHIVQTNKTHLFLFLECSGIV